VTCCYCGTRAALVLKGKDRHELACSSCGAPLHDLKMLRKDRDGPRELVPPSRVRSGAPSKPKRSKKSHRPKPAKRKRRKGLMSKIFEEAFDVIEDIFD
jgi:hypothetical protein